MSLTSPCDIETGGNQNNRENTDPLRCEGALGNAPRLPKRVQSLTGTTTAVTLACTIGAPAHDKEATIGTFASNKRGESKGEKVSVATERGRCWKQAHQHHKMPSLSTAAPCALPRDTCTTSTPCSRPTWCGMVTRASGATKPRRPSSLHHSKARRHREK